MGKKMREFIVKLEYSLYAKSEKDAVDFLLSAVRIPGDREPGRGLATLRTDARRPREIGGWQFDAGPLLLTVPTHHQAFVQPCR